MIRPQIYDESSGLRCLQRIKVNSKGSRTRRTDTVEGRQVHQSGELYFAIYTQTPTVFTCGFHAQGRVCSSATCLCHTQLMFNTTYCTCGGFEGKRNDEME